jgi:hypothetical protein
MKDKDPIEEGLLDIKFLLLAIILILVGILFSTSLSAQDNWWKLDKKDIWASSAMFLAGWADGTAEITKWDYASYEAFYGDVNDAWHNPDISWKNKYKNREVSDGPAFIGSTTVFVGGTDAYHALRTLRNFSIGATFLLMPRCENNWKTFVLRVICYTFANRAGFWVGYELPRYLNK